MEKKLKALIVDDERLARRDLILLLESFDHIQVIGEADSVENALTAIKDLHPDLLFLDIQMPGESGFDLLEKLEDPPKTIFVTAFDEYAIRAFEINALDYLLKPVNPERLALSLERLEHQKEENKKDWRLLTYDDRLFLLVDDRMQFLKVSNILTIKAAGDYSEVLKTNIKRGLTTKTMKEWEHRLPPGHFCRIHRSTIINMDYVEQLEEWFNYSYKVHMKGLKEPLVMSRRYVARLKEKLG
jgi:two-component system LytT family response regulator